MKKYIIPISKILFPFILGGSILYWMYRDFPFSSLDNLLWNEMHWEWMFLSFIPGIFAQVFRGLRWRQALDPMGEHPRRSTCINAIFVSYASSLIIPRRGEIIRCGILKSHDSTSFGKSLGTVITERIVDSFLMLLLTGAVLLYQLPVILEFFNLTGVGFTGLLQRFTPTGIFVTILCGCLIAVMVIFAIKQFSVARKIKDVLRDIIEGILSLKKVHNIPLYLFYSVGIWVSYFLHYWLTFYCFDFTAHMGITAALISFCIGSIAVIVPTPNGAGSWHFAVKTILVLYGLNQIDAVAFALIVHSVQTLLLIALGVYALIALQFIYSKNANIGKEDTT